MRVPFMFRPGESLGASKPSKARILIGIAAGLAALIAAGYFVSTFVRKPAAIREESIALAPHMSRSEIAGEAPERKDVVARDRSVAGSGNIASWPDTQAARARKVATSYSMSVETSDFQVFYGKLAKMAGEAGGYNTEEGRSKGADGRMRGRVSMRLPAGGVESVLRRVREQSDVVRESGTSEDLTEQYYDLDARIRNAKAAEARLTEIVRGRAGKVSEVLEVEREMTRVRGEIESMEARKRSMDIRTDMVSLTVDVAEPERSSPVARRLWTPVRTAFGDGLLLLALSVRYLVIALLAAIPWVLAFAAARRLFASRRNGKGGLEPPK